MTTVRCGRFSRLQMRDDSLPLRPVYLTPHVSHYYSRAATAAKAEFCSRAQIDRLAGDLQARAGCENTAVRAGPNGRARAGRVISPRNGPHAARRPRFVVGERRRYILEGKDLTSLPSRPTMPRPVRGRMQLSVGSGLPRKEAALCRAPAVALVLDSGRNHRARGRAGSPAAETYFCTALRMWVSLHLHLAVQVVRRHRVLPPTRCRLLLQAPRPAAGRSLREQEKRGETEQSPGIMMPIGASGGR